MSVFSVAGLLIDRLDHQKYSLVLSRASYSVSLTLQTVSIMFDGVLTCCRAERDFVSRYWPNMVYTEIPPLTTGTQPRNAPRQNTTASTCCSRSTGRRPK